MLECGREKFLVFAHHKLVLDHITAELVKKVRCAHAKPFNSPLAHIILISRYCLKREVFLGEKINKQLN